MTWWASPAHVVKDGPSDGVPSSVVEKITFGRHHNTLPGTSANQRNNRSAIKIEISKKASSGFLQGQGIFHSTMNPKKKDENSEWTTVTKSSKRRIAKRSRSRRIPTTSSTNMMSTSSTSSLSLEVIQQGIDTCVEELQHSDFFQNFQTSLSSISWHQPVSCIVCYGIGNFGAKTFCAPMWQLSCAVALRKLLKETSTEKAIEMLYFEPCMTNTEAIILERYAIQIIPNNEQGKRQVGQDDHTIFFMPHCPLALYTNVLHTNWNHLQNVVIFGNSLSAYANRLEIDDKVRFLRLLEPHWKEDSIKMSKEDIVERTGYFEQAFNDSSITHIVTNNSDTKWPKKPAEIQDDTSGETI